ncbi:MAG: hypothetical protein ACTTKH_00020 [Treponema sp.]
MFMYGIGLERLSILSGNNLKHSHFYLKSLTFVFSTSTVAYVLFNFFLKPLYLSFLFPLILIALLFFFEKGVAYLYAGFVDSTPQIAEHEKIFTFGTVIISLYESAMYVEILFIIAISFLLMIFFHAILKAIRKRIDVFNIENRWNNLSLLLISFGFIASALYFIDVMYASNSLIN